MKRLILILGFLAAAKVCGATGITYGSPPAAAAAAAATATGQVDKSTFVYTISVGGGVQLSTTNPAPGSTFAIGRSTWHVLDVRAYIIYPSSSERTAFQLARATSTGNGTPWVPLTPNIHVTSATVDGVGKFSVWTTTGFDMQSSTNIFGVMITTVPDHGGDWPSEWGFQIRAWSDPEQYPAFP